MAGRRPRWWSRLATAPRVIDEWGPPMTKRTRHTVLVAVCAMWLVACGLSFHQGKIPGAELLAVPIGAVIALGGRHGGGDDRTDRESGGDDR